MKVERRRTWSVVAVVAALGMLAGCGGGDSGNDELVDPPPATTGSSVTGPTTTTGGTLEPVYVNGVPQVTATPTRAAAYATVRLEGAGFTDDKWRFGNGQLLLLDQRQEADCLLIALVVDHDLTVTADGRLSGSFVVPPTAGCQLGAGQARSGRVRYDIAYQCNDCRIGTFTVILDGQSTEEPTGTRCEGTVAFGVQNFAHEINADGLSCEEAESFLRDNARPWRPPDGPAQVDAGGFSCQRTGLSTTALPPEADYKCTDGSRTIWFVRQ